MVYENAPIQGCKRICHLIGYSQCEKLKKFYILPYRPPKGPYKIWSGFSKNYICSIMLFESCRAWKMLNVFGLLDLVKNWENGTISSKIDRP